MANTTVKRDMATAALGALLLALPAWSEPAPTSSTRPTPKEEQPAAFRILFGGDVASSAGYESFLPQFGSEATRLAPQFERSFEALVPLLRSADLRMVNLESALTNLPSSPLRRKKLYLHRGDRVKTPRILKGQEIGAVSLGNNHSMDYGAFGLRQTLETLDRLGIDRVGAGLDARSAAAPLRWPVALADTTFELAVVAGFEHREDYEKTFHFYAEAEKPGVNLWTPERATHQVADLRRKEPRLFIVAFPHWGKNYEPQTARQTALAHALIDAGADLVIGHGAHLLQGLESYRDRWVIYSLGNLIFNTPGRYQRLHKPDLSLVARLDLQATGGQPALSLRLYPILSDNLSTGFQPRPAERARAEEARDLLLRHSPKPKELSSQLGLEQDELGFFFRLEIP